MIDTDKYEGHTEGFRNGSWDLFETFNSNNVLMKSIRPYHDKWGIDLPMVASKDAQLIADAPLLLAEVKRLSEIEQEWLVMWATLEELNLVADVRKNMTLHGFVFPTDEDMEGDEE